MKELTIERGKTVIRITRPELTEQERAKRLKQIQSAAAELMKEKGSVNQ